MFHHNALHANTRPSRRHTDTQKRKQTYAHYTPTDMHLHVCRFYHCLCVCVCVCVSVWVCFSSARYRSANSIGPGLRPLSEYRIYWLLLAAAGCVCLWMCVYLSGCYGRHVVRHWTVVWKARHCRPSSMTQTEKESKVWQVKYALQEL